MPDQPGDFRSWLTEALERRVRHPALEDTLFHQLEELERGPLEQLGRLVRLAIDELRVAQARLSQQARDVRALQETVAVLSARVDALSETAAPPAAPPAVDGHVLLLSTADGYRLAVRAGAPPAPGDEVDEDGRRYRVLNLGRSPLPGDRRAAALALPV